MIWRDVLADVSAKLGSAAEARHIVEEACGVDWFSQLDAPVSTRAMAYVDGMVSRRGTGEPLQYVIGRWGFRSLDLLVDHRVLIPRPETEIVVEEALKELALLAPAQPTVIDLGTGSGAIALSVASEVPRARVWATEASVDALAVARANLAGMGTEAATRVRLVEGDWFSALSPLLQSTVDLIVSNPPYVGEGEVADLPPEVAHWEPRAALVSGPNGLEAIDTIVEQAPRWLVRPGALVVEIAPHQADAAQRLAYEAGFLSVEVRPDLAGRHRVLVARTS